LLAGQSIELALKVFLLLKGYSDSQLRNISHNLERALDEATTAGFPALFSLPPEQVAAIRAVNPYYNSNDLEYLTRGYKSYPDHRLLLAFAEQTLDVIKASLQAWRPPTWRESRFTPWLNVRPSRARPSTARSRRSGSH